MGEVTGISWTHHSLNLWIGCEKVSEGCKFCYAERMQRVWKQAHWGSESAGGTRTRTTQKNWDQLQKWNAAAVAAGERRRVFINSMSDFFEDWTGPVQQAGRDDVANGLDGIRREAFAMFDWCQNLDFLLVTKRPQNIRRMCHDSWTEKVMGHLSQNEGDGKRWRTRNNIWLLTSVENQPEFDSRVKHLRQCRNLVPVLGISAEPLLGSITLRLKEHSLDWVIAGGESGSDAKRREMSLDAMKSLCEQCQAAGVPFFCKQDSARKDGQQGRIPDHIWNTKQFPVPS